MLAVTGDIEDIGKDITERPYVSFKLNFLENVTCYFSKENNPEIAKLNKDETTTIVWKSEGMILKNIVVEDCKVFQ